MICARKVLVVIAVAGVLTGCSWRGVEDLPMSEGHLSAPEAAPASSSEIPAPVRVSATVPPPQTTLAEPTHTVVVYDVPLSELLFSLARDSSLNLDIDPEISETITLNAVEQTLPALLERISKSVDIRYSIEGNVLRVERDSPFIRNYAVDYLNMTRNSIGTVAVSTQISSTGAGGDGNASTRDNSSDTVVESQTDHAFWDSLQQNIEAIISDGSVADTTLSTVNSNIIVNRESGIVAVRATSRQHQEVESFINTVQVSTQRQVLIEATIAEVNLSDRYQAGIDWRLVNPDTGTTGVEANQLLTDIGLLTRPTFNITSNDLDLAGNELQTTLTALETFGDVTVMSSPKVMAMNNQTALLKVVDNLIYFTVDVNIDTSSGGAVDGGSLTTFETEVNTVPVGFVMSVTPYIDKAETVILNVRPTISRVIDFVQDPNPALADVGVVSEIPVIQVREVESILKVSSGDIAVIGGLMQDEVQKNQRGLPLLQSVPGLGRVFRYDDNQTNKTELVIFLKPTVIGNASVRGELSSFQNYLPSVN